MSAGEIILSYRWTNQDYDLVIWGYSTQISVDSAFSTAQLITLTSYKASSFTVMDTGGVDASSGFGEPRCSTMPSLSSFGSFDIRVASAGTSGLTAGTRTLSNAILEETIPTGTVAKSVSKAGQHVFFVANPVLLHANEGVVVKSMTDIVGGTIVPEFSIDFDIVPTEISSRIYS